MASLTDNAGANVNAMANDVYDFDSFAPGAVTRDATMLRLYVKGALLQSQDIGALGPIVPGCPQQRPLCWRPRGLSDRGLPPLQPGARCGGNRIAGQRIRTRTARPHLVKEGKRMLRGRIQNTIRNLQYRLMKRSSRGYVQWLRNEGIKVGKRVEIKKPWTVSIDTTRPSLVTIGNNVRINKGFCLHTHDYAGMVLIDVYKEFIASSGRVTIGDNVYFGWYCTVMKGVTIGDNCIIGGHSLVLKDIPSNSVAVGSPAKVICSLDDYYHRRKTASVEEAKDYARSIQERFGRRPVLADFWEEFPLFLKKDELPPDIPVKFQMGPAYEHYRQHHVPAYTSFEKFLRDAGL